MQTNKNKSLLFTKLAFEQAKINLGSTGTNPSVGCVVEKNGSVISSGFTSLNGRPHAEYNALNKNLNFKRSNIFISLEPCSHFGKTKPCTNIIKKKGIKKVSFSIFDIDKRSKKLAKKVLRKKNIIVKSGLLSKYAKIFYKDYFLGRKKKFPLIDAKIAVSKDYYTKNKKNDNITNIHSIKRVHLLRSKYNCIISTSKTINEDNSKLDCRIQGITNKSPDLVIIDRNFKLKKKIDFLKIKNRKVIIFTSKKDKSKELYFKKKNVKVTFLKKMSSNEDYTKIFKILNKYGYSRIFVETGLVFLNFLISNKFLNNLYIFKTNISLGSKGFNYGSSKFLKKIKLKKKINVNLFNNSLYKIDLK